MLPKGIHQIVRTEFQKCIFFSVSEGFTSPSYPVSTQARNVVLVLRFGHCLYSSLGGGNSPRFAPVSHLVPFMLDPIEENVTKYTTTYVNLLLFLECASKKCAYAPDALWN